MMIVTNLESTTAAQSIQRGLITNSADGLGHTKKGPGRGRFQNPMRSRLLTANLLSNENQPPPPFWWWGLAANRPYNHCMRFNPRNKRHFGGWGVVHSSDLGAGLFCTSRTWPVECKHWSYRKAIGDPSFAASPLSG